MNFRNEKHKTLFQSAAKGMNTSDKALMCKLYLLTADRKLWQISETVDRQEPDPAAAHPSAGRRGGMLYFALLRKRSDAGNETFEYRRSCGQGSDYAADV